jgi:hypothetical protein
MVSKDLQDILQKIHTERYEIARTVTHGERKGSGTDFNIETSIILEKEGEQVTITTSEPDCIIYVARLRSIVLTDGKILRVPVKNTELYNRNIGSLIDKDNIKIEDALRDIVSGKFVFTYSPQKLTDELLESPANIKTLRNPKFLPLLKDYFYILALILKQSQELLRMHNELEKKTPEIKESLTAMGWIYAGFSLVTKNPIKNYRYFKSHVSFDSDRLFEQLSHQMEIIDEVYQSLIAKGRLNWRRDIPKMMGIYTRCIEPLRPLINLLRVGLELREGVRSPKKDYTLIQNIAILKSHAKYSSLFACLDEQIRHGDAHTSTFVKGNQVEIRNGLTRKSKVIRTFKCNELANIILEMRQQFFPALMTATILNDFALLDQVLISVEYKLLLASLGNC